MNKEIICISCPIGCRLNVEWDESREIDSDNIQVKNNKCKRGIIYGKEEILAPKRVVTASCAVKSIHIERIPVKSTGPVLKEQINPLLENLYQLSLDSPIQIGDIVIKDFKGSGIDIVATRSLSD